MEHPHASHPVEPNTQYPDCSNCYLHYNFIISSYCNVYCTEHEPKMEKPASKCKSVPGTAYAFTLTSPPDYVNPKPIEEAVALIMEHGRTSKPEYDKPVQWAYVLEHTEAGTPHIHGVYQTACGKRLETRYFSRYWKIWDEKIKLGHGHKGGYHLKARHTESYDAYIQKEGVVVRDTPDLKSTPLV